VTTAQLTASRTHSGRAADYLALCKLRMTTMVAASAAVGFYLGHQGPLSPRSFITMLLMVIGTGLVAIGSGIANQIMERRLDAQMARTRNRPLAAGRIGRREAWAFCMVASTAGLALLGLGINQVSAAAAAVAWLSYVIAYTPLKRVTPWSVLVGAVPGALPTVIGWSAAGGSVDRGALLLFAIVFVWQVPHFLAIAWVYRDDYGTAGYRVLTVVAPEGPRVVQHVIAGCLLLIPVSLLPTFFGLAGAIYYVGALGIGIMFLVFGLELARLRDLPSARQLMLASLVYLPTLLLLMTVDKVAV